MWRLIVPNHKPEAERFFCRVFEGGALEVGTTRQLTPTPEGTVKADHTLSFRLQIDRPTDRHYFFFLACAKCLRWGHRKRAGTGQKDPAECLTVPFPNPSRAAADWVLPEGGGLRCPTLRTFCPHVTKKSTRHHHQLRESHSGSDDRSAAANRLHTLLHTFG